MYLPGGSTMSRRRITVTTILVGWLFAVLAAPMAIAPPPAHGEPFSMDTPDNSTSPANTVNLGWPGLGLPPTLRFNGIDSSQEYTVPVPAGLTATRLRGIILPPVDLGAGTLEINDRQGNFLATVDFPSAGPNVAAMPFDVDISGAQVTAAGLGLSLTMRQFNASNQSCTPIGSLLRVRDLVTVYTGTEAPPNTIATFFPPTLQAVTIYAPVDSDKAEQQAVLTLASAISRLYAPQPVKINAVPQPRGATPPSAVQFTRAIVVERGPASLQVNDPGAPDTYLRLTGRGDELSNQVSLLMTQLQSLDQTASGRVDQAGARAQLPDKVTFAQLNMSGRANVLGSGGLSVGFDRAALGAPRFDDVEVHLRASYTPMHDFEQGTLVITSNGTVAYSNALSRNGVLDITFSIPRAALGQRINIDLAMTYMPARPCEAITPPLVFQVDPQSTITFHRGGPPAGGFKALPSEFSPNFVVGLDGSSPYQLGYATRVIADIARQTSAPLTPAVVDAKAAVSSNSSALIVANGATLKSTDLNPPVASDGSAITVDLPTQLRANLDKGLGSIQVFADSPRNRTVVLVTTSDNWALVNPLLDYIDGLPSGWSQLTGDVLAAGSAGTPVNFSVRSDTPVGVALKPFNLMLWISVGVGAVLLLVGVFVVIRLRRASPLPR